MVRRLSSILAALLILSTLALLWRHDRPEPLDRYDQRFYLGIAFDLRHHHRFTDGFFFDGGDDRTIRPSGMRFTPLYPVLLAGAAALDPAFAAATDCVVAHRGAADTCSRAGGHVRQLQFLLLAAIFWMTWWQAAACTGRVRTGWIALAVSLPTAPLLLLSVDYLMTEITSLFLAMLAQTAVLGAMADPRRRTAWSLAAGSALGLATLARPAFLLLAVAAIVVAVLLGLRRRGILRPACCFALAALLPVGGWIARNLVVMHRAALTFGYASHTFVQRLSFDTMTWREYALSFACWMPDGNGIGALLAGRHACDRFGWDDHADSFYAIGIGPMLRDTLQQAGGWEHHMRFLLRSFLLADPPRQVGWHLMVTIPLALRGAFVDHWWGFVLSIPCAALTALALAARCRALRRQRSCPPVVDRFLVVSLPAWFMLGLNAAIAVNQTRYNLMLIAPFAIAAALAIEAPRRGG